MKPLQEMPPRLFRFLPKQATDVLNKNFLDEKKLWFSNILDFNDPFDATASLTELVDQIYQELTAKRWANQPMPEDMPAAIERDEAEALPILTRFMQEKWGQCFGVLCFSEKNDVVPMWAHYGSNHEGLAIEFDPAHPLFNSEDFGKVEYDCVRPQVTETSPPAETRKWIFKKSPEWRGEFEWRLVKSWRDLKETIKPWDKTIGRYLDLPPEAVSAVYFGCRATPRLTESIESSCKRSEFRDVKLFHMQPDCSHYKLNAVPWTGHKNPMPGEERALLEVLWRIYTSSFHVPR